MPDKRKNIRESFLTAMFSLLGYVANCDEPINRSEIQRIKLYMKKMHLSEDEYQKALSLIKLGASPEFNASEALQKFLESTTPKLIQILLVYLVTVAKADGYLVEKEFHAIQWIARKLNYKSIAFSHLLRILYEQDQIASSRSPQSAAPLQDSFTPTYQSYTKGNSGSGPAHADANTNNQDLLRCYDVLGVSSEMTDDEIRMAYKKMVNQYHPDKLTGQGLPPEQLDEATEYFKKIQVAYAFIKKYRSLYAAN